MSLSELRGFFQNLLALKELPSFLCGAAVGFACILLLLKYARRWVNDGLVKHLRAQIEKLNQAQAEWDVRDEHQKNQIDGLGKERAWLKDQTKIQEGQMANLREQIIQLSADCEERTSKLTDADQKLRQERKARRDLQRQVKVYSGQLDEVDNSDGKIWDRRAGGISKPFVPLSMRKAAIISVVNLKGGVGKTTITANLGASLAAQGLRVLLVDLDHQGSLSNLCLTEEERRDVRQAHRYVDDFFEDGGDLSAFRKTVTKLQTATGPGQLHLAPVHEDFVDLENKLQARWHVGQIAEDVRFRLRGGLHSMRLRDFYDVVLVDCPPRWSTGSINAIGASDYVLIPVLLEQTSAEAVPRILGWLKQFQENCCPELNVLGVVGNKASNRDPLVSRQRRVWAELKDQSRDAWKGQVHLFQEVIREHPEHRGAFASLDPKYQDRYTNLIHQIRQVIPHAHLQPSAIPPLAGAAVGGGGH